MNFSSNRFKISRLLLGARHHSMSSNMGQCFSTRVDLKIRLKFHIAEIKHTVAD